MHMWCAFMRYDHFVFPFQIRNTPLHFAVCQGRIDVVSLLMATGAAADTQDDVSIADYTLVLGVQLVR